MNTTNPLLPYRTSPPGKGCQKSTHHRCSYASSITRLTQAKSQAGSPFGDSYRPSATPGKPWT